MKLAPWIIMLSIATAGYGCNGGSGDEGSGGGGGVSPDAGAGSGGGGAGGSAGAGATGGGNAGDGGVADGGGSAGEGAPAATEAEACVRYVEGWCLRAVRCGNFDDLLECMERVGPYCPDLFFADGSQRTVEGMLECADMWETWRCGRSAPPCIVAGTRADGEACIGVAQCQGSCTGGGLSSCGQCEPRIPQGSPCSTGPGLCEIGSYCDDTTGLCEPFDQLGDEDPPPGPGESCQSRPCADGYYCGRNEDGALVCMSPPDDSVPRPGAEETCERYGTPCSEGLSCVCDTSGCSCLAPRRIGEACGAPGEVCHAAATCTGGTCVSNVTAGAFEEACGAP